MNDTTEGILAIKNIIHFLVPGVNFDNGGVNSDDVVQYLSDRNIVNVVYNPENTDIENRDSLRALEADTSTSISVLNVILSLDERIEHIKMMKKYTKQNGLFIFKIYEGNSSCILSHTGTKYAQLNMPIELYATLLHKEFRYVLMYKSRSMYVCYK
jgi:hypothetical protein